MCSSAQEVCISPPTVRVSLYSEWSMSSACTRKRPPVDVRLSRCYALSRERPRHPLARDISALPAPKFTYSSVACVEPSN